MSAGPDLIKQFDLANCVHRLPIVCMLVNAELLGLGQSVDCSRLQRAIVNERERRRLQYEISDIYPLVQFWLFSERARFAVTINLHDTKTAWRVGNRNRGQRAVNLVNLKQVVNIDIGNPITVSHQKPIAAQVLGSAPHSGAR